MKKSASNVSALSSTLKKPFVCELEVSDDEIDWSPFPQPKRIKSDVGESKIIRNYQREFILQKEASPLGTGGFGSASKFAEKSRDAFPCFSPLDDVHDDPSSFDQLKKDSCNDLFSDESKIDQIDESPVKSQFSPSNSLGIDDDLLEEILCTSPHSKSHLQSKLEPQSPLEPFTPNKINFSSATSPASPTKPKAQPIITNYFGISMNDGSIKTTSITVDLSNPKKRKSSSFTSLLHDASTSTEHPIPIDSTKKPAVDQFNGFGKFQSYSKAPTVKASCPFYKRISGTNFIVDDFRYIYESPNCKSFFLSHFHSDHYQGLNSKFDRGMIYCSSITASLLVNQLRVSQNHIKVIHIRQPVIIDGVQVTFFDANHCPGSVIILFQFSDGSQHLHTGDFRFDPNNPDHSYLLQLKISNLYLDTTYADPQYTFPPQADIIDQILDVMQPAINDQKTLIIVGTYTIGKEKVFLSAAERFNVKFFAKPAKLKVLKCLELEAILRQMCTQEANQAKIHILPIFDLSVKKLEAYLKANPKWNKIVAFRPTGWSFSTKSSSKTSSKSKAFPLNSSGNISIYSVPYSEHSSFAELCTFVRTLKPKWIIPTVNNRSREAVMEMVRNLRGNP